MTAAAVHKPKAMPSDTNVSGSSATRTVGGLAFGACHASSWWYGSTPCRNQRADIMNTAKSSGTSRNVFNAVGTIVRTATMARSGTPNIWKFLARAVGNSRQSNDFEHVVAFGHHEPLRQGFYLLTSSLPHFLTSSLP